MSIVGICIYTAHVSLALDRNSEILHFENSDVLEICDGVMFIFYQGLKLPYMYIVKP